MNQRRKKKGQVPPIASTSGCPESHHGHGPHASPARLPHAALRRTIRRQGDEVLRRKISRARNPQHSEKSQRPRPRGYSHHRCIREVSEELPVGRRLVPESRTLRTPTAPERRSCVDCWNSSLDHAWKPKIRMVEDVKKLTLKAQLYMFGQGKPFGQVEVAPDEIGTTKGITAEVSELAGLSPVAPIALAGARINRR